MSSHHFKPPRPPAAVFGQFCIAVIVTRDTRYLTFSAGGYPDVILPQSFREWHRKAELERAQLYPAAAFKVSQWMDQNDGVFGVRVALKALAEGEVINFN